MTENRNKIKELTDTLSLGGWDKFPVTRPLILRPLKVVIDGDGVEKVGKGVNTNGPNYTGVAIKIDDHVYDSNHVIWWKYS